MSHAARRLAEIKGRKPEPKKQASYRPRPRPIKIRPSDADSLRFIAGRLRHLGWPNFAAELERIATESVPAQGAESDVEFPK